MALPGGRKIVVDGKTYQWICRLDRRASREYEDDWGCDVRFYDKVVTIKAVAGGRHVQHKLAVPSVTPEWVASMIRAEVVRKRLP